MSNDRGLSGDELVAWRRFVDMHHFLERHLVGHLQRESGLSAADFEVLVNLSEAPAGRMRAAELAAATQWEKSRLSHHLVRMQKRGLVCRRTSEGRYPDVVITDEGRTAINSAAPANARRVRELFIDVLGPQRLRQLRSMSEDVIAAVEAHSRDGCALDEGAAHSSFTADT